MDKTNEIVYYCAMPYKKEDSDLRWYLTEFFQNLHVEKLQLFTSEEEARYIDDKLNKSEVTEIIKIARNNNGIISFYREDVNLDTRDRFAVATDEFLEKFCEIWE